MNRFLLIFGIICFWLFSISGCGESTDTKEAAPDKTAEEVVQAVAPEVEITTEAAEKVEKEARQAIEDTKKIAGDAAETTKQGVADAVDAAEDKASEATETAVSAMAGQVNAAADVIVMKNTEAFSDHKMGIVLFSHKKHTVAAPDGYGIACGECHHDKDGNPLELTEGDMVQGCMECHDKAEKPKKPAEISKEDWDAMQLEYYYGALHSNCIDCHKTGGAGPVKCAECHPKPEP